MDARGGTGDAAGGGGCPARPGPAPGIYERRRPESTTLYQIVQQHLELVRRRVLRWFARSGLLDAADARDMLGWDNGGFSLDASVRITGEDRAGLERLLRYCARPPFALERLEQVGEHRVIYRLPKPRRDGCTKLVLTPLELIDHLAALIPPPRLHRHRYHGVLAPNSPLRAAAVAYGRDEDGSVAAVTPDAASTPTGEEKASRSAARYLWSMLLARLLESLLSAVDVPELRCGHAYRRLHHRGCPGAAHSRPHRRADRAAADCPGTRATGVGRRARGCRTRLG